MAAASDVTTHSIECISLSNPSDHHRVVVKEYPPSASAAVLQHFPVLLVHALTRQSGDFEVLLPALRDAGFTVATWNVVGRGDSDYATNACDYGYPQVCIDATPSRWPFLYE